MHIAIKYSAEYGPVVSAHLGPRAFVFLGDPQDIEIILSSPVHIEKSVEYRLFEPWLGDGLLITKGDKWRKHRKAIAPAFHMSILKTFAPLFYENSLDLVPRLREKVGQKFDCHDYLSAATVDILTETAMGVRRERRQNTGYDYAMAVMKLSDIVHRRHFDLSLRLDVLFKFSKLAKVQKSLLQTIHTLTENVIREKWKVIEEEEQNKTLIGDIEMEKSIAAENARDNSGTANYTKLHYAKDDLDDIDENDTGEKKRLAFLEMLMDMKKNGGQMTDEEIWEEVNTIMFEGHDTTAAGSSFALCALGSLPEIQEHEINHYCFKVTANYVVPKDVTVVIGQFVAHRNEKYYPNPLVFNPDNFLPEKMQRRHYYAFIPFSAGSSSAGPRSCVGRKYAMLKLKVLLSTILRNYRITSDVSYQDFDLQGDIILKRTDGFNIKIEPRKSASK
ncbi:Cytochrome P450 4g15 [Harpegnathos saltator]|uniref:Cytochrome P450 4g15 n=1 Tax=Harpegnathos saltator TaxID=610380 RepID=E2BFW7_HARSA|nr:Cytochrome P450 4g15 [Harpegnathos saltator]